MEKSTEKPSEKNLEKNKSKAVFDKVDQQILAILREDGRASHAMIAKEVKLSAPAVGERIRKLEQSGVVLGYRAVLNPEAFDRNISAFVALSPQARSPAKELVNRLKALPEIEELHAVAGEDSYIAKVRVANTASLDVFLDTLFMLEGVERTRTTIILKTDIERPIHLPFLDSD